MLQCYSQERSEITFLPFGYSIVIIIDSRSNRKFLEGNSQSSEILASGMHTVFKIVNV